MSQPKAMDKPRKSGRWGIILPVILLLVLLLARYLPLNIAPPNTDAFSLSATDLPDTGKVGDPLTVTATLTYAPLRSFLATVGSSPIYIELIREGDPAHSYTLIAQHIYLPAGGHHSETAVFTPDRAGRYTLRVSADFKIGNQEYTLALPEHTVTVTE